MAESAGGAADGAHDAGRPDGGAGPAGAYPRSALRGHRDSVLCLAADAAGARLASGSADGTCRVWDLRAAGGARCVRGVAVRAEVAAVSFCPGLEHLLLVASGVDLLGYDLRSDRVLLQEPAHRLPGVAEDEINQVVVDSSGAFAAVAEDSGAAHWVDVRAWRRERTFAGKHGHTNICSSVALRPGRTWGLASGGLDAAVVLWTRTGRGRRVQLQPDASDDASACASGGPQLCNPPFVHSVAYSPDGQHVAAGLGDGSVAVLEAGAGGQVQRLRGHAAAVCQVLYAGPLLFSAGNDQRLCAWRPAADAPTGPEDSLRLDDKVNALAWAGDALFVAGLGPDITSFEGWSR